MRTFTLPILLAASLVLTAPVQAQAQTGKDLGDVFSGIAQSLLAQEADRNAYIQAQNLNTVRGYRSYLANHPNGAYRGNAERALARLGAVVNPNNPPPTDGSTQTAASVEASIGLSRSQHIQIQRQLTAIGYPTGGADGLWGAKTRAAIGQWQKANKLSITGYVTARQVRLIAQQAGTAVDPAPNLPDQTDDAVEERLLSLSYDERRQVQRRLTLLGYRTYGIDGSFGRNTRQALAAWQRDEGLRASGYLTADQFRLLLRETGE